MASPIRLADRKGLFGAIIRGGQMIDTGHERAKLPAIGDDAADRDATEADAVIAALATDQSHAPRIATYIVVGECDLERGVDRLRAGIAEEDVIEIGRRKRRNARGEFEGLGMGELEGGSIIEFLRLGLDGRDNGISVVARIGTPKARGAIDHPAAVRGDV